MTDLIQPNTNLALPQNYSMVIESLKNVTFNMTRVKFPGAQGGQASTPTPLQRLHLSGDSFEHDPLEMEVLLNEDWSSWYSLFQWMERRTISESFTDYQNQQNTPTGIYSQGSIQLYSSANNPTKKAVFEEMFPISVGGFTLDSQVQEPTPITFSVVFQYQKFQLI